MQPMDAQPAFAEPLVLLLRTWLTGRLTDLPRAPGLWAAAAAHRLGGTLYHIGAPLDDIDARRARAAWTANVAAHLRRVAALEAHWPASAPPPLVFKGADIGEHLFDDPGARQAVDLDLLLPSPAFEAAADVLATRATEVHPARYERFRDEPSHVAGFVLDGVLIELHRDPQPPHRARLRGHEVWARASDGHLGNVKVRVPRPLDRLLLWLTNQAKGAFFGDLADLLDLALVLRALPAPRWPAAAEAAAAAGLGRAWSLALRRLGQSGLWPDALPPGDRRAAALDRLLPPPTAPRREPPQARFQFIKLALCEPPAQRATLARAAAAWMRGERPGPT